MDNQGRSGRENTETCSRSRAAVRSANQHSLRQGAGHPKSPSNGEAVLGGGGPSGGGCADGPIIVVGSRRQAGSQSSARSLRSSAHCSALTRGWRRAATAAAPAVLASTWSCWRGLADMASSGCEDHAGQEGETFLYFAYGSNLLTERIHLRNPSAVFCCVARLQVSAVVPATGKAGQGRPLPGTFGYPQGSQPSTGCPFPPSYRMPSMGTSCFPPRACLCHRTCPTVF